MTEHRLKTNNLVGPAGFISMEDGCVGGWVQHAAEADRRGADGDADGRPHDRAEPGHRA